MIPFVPVLRKTERDKRVGDYTGVFMFENMLNKMPYGGDYNPEQWDEDTWPEDMRLLREAGVDIVTLNVFSWALIQPDEDTYDFSKLDRIVKTVTDAGMNICMATGTGAMPAWMARRHPDVLRVEWNGMNRKFGGRENLCPNSPTTLKYVPALARKMAEHYQGQKNIIAWHVSNEYSGRCYCENCEKAFRIWLRSKYRSLDNLNREWNTAFWGHTFYDWDEIVAPNQQSEEFGDQYNARTTFQGISIDYARFMSDSLLNNYKSEYEEIKKYFPHTPVTTNLMGAYKEVDYQKWAPFLDFAAEDNYPWPGESESSVGFTLDLIRGLKQGQSWWLMEQTPSVSNWMVNCSLKRPGVMRLWSYQSVAHGADSVMFFQMRRSIGACEKYHGAVIDHVGTGNTRIYREIQALGGELETLGDTLLEARTHSDAAIIFDWDNWWAVEYSAGPSAYLKYVDEIKKYYDALHRLHISVDIISCEDDLSAYKTVFAPLLYMVKPGVADRIERYVKEGGRFVTTAFSGYVNENDRVTVGGYPGELRSLLGIWVEEIDALPQEVENHFDMNGRTYPARIVCDIMHPEGAEVISSYKEDFYAGTPVICANSYGKGMGYYIGTSSDTRFYMDFVSGILGMSGDDILKDFPTADPDDAKYIETAIREKDGVKFLFILNHCDEKKEIRIPVDGQEIITSRTFKQGESIVLEKYDVMIIRVQKIQ